MVWALLLTVLFSLGLIKLLLLRFEAGDVYPVYSSLRSDPLGIQVLFESINEVVPKSALRNYRNLEQFTADADRTLLICGMQPGAFPMQSGTWEQLMDKLAASGGRLVITFKAGAERGDPHEGADEERDEEESLPGDAAGDEGEQRRPDHKDEAFQSQEIVRWGIRLRQGGYPGENAVFALRRMMAPETDLPETIAWPGALYFEPQDKDWRVVYARAGHPVIVTRQWGKASLVMAADSYLLSNEAMRNDRSPLLLAWLLKPGRPLIVDETHHGLFKQPGIAGLARKYKLHGVFAALLLLVGLFIWQQAVAFVPPPENDLSKETECRQIGPDTAEGLIILLQHHIRPSDLLTVCFEAWRDSPAASRYADTRITEVGDIVLRSGANRGKSNPVTVYRRIHERLNKGSTQ